MNTRQLTRSAMLCALYGLILFINSISALSVETYFPFLLAVPILANAALYPPKVSLTSFAAMAVMTLMLSSMTTWLYAFSYLLAGLLFGIGIHEKKSSLLTSLLCMIVLFVCNYLSLTVFAAVFGYDPAEAQMIAAAFGNLIPWQTLLILMALLLGFTQTIVIYCLALIMVERMHIDMQRLSLPHWQDIDKRLAWGFPISAALAGAAIFFKAPQWAISAALLLFLFFFVLMVYAGSQVLLHKIRTAVSKKPADEKGKSRSQMKKKRSSREFRLIFLLVFTAFVPGIDLFHALTGFFSILHSSKHAGRPKTGYGSLKGDSYEKI